jgi:hypothetical protein
MGVLLVSETKLKAFTNINKNVDMDVLKAELQIAQDINVQTILGTKFYVHLLDQITATGNTLNANEKTLVDDYISPWLIQQAYADAMPHLWARTMNRGIVEGQMENANSIDVGTMQYLRTIQKQRADFYLTRLQDYLLIGKGNGQFPQYLSANTNEGMLPDKTQKYNNGIFLNKVTRTGYNMKQIAKVMPVYSEIEHENPPCSDCY